MLTKKWTPSTYCANGMCLEAATWTRPSGCHDGACLEATVVEADPCGEMYCPTCSDRVVGVRNNTTPDTVLEVSADVWTLFLDAVKSDAFTREPVCV